MTPATRSKMIEEASELMWVGLPDHKSEYLRGMSELIARCFQREDTADEAEEIRKEILAMAVQA